jgi:hypothetical protein
MPRRRSKGGDLERLKRELLAPARPVVHSITAEEQVRVRDVPQLVRSRKEQRRRRFTGVEHYEDDRAGRPCACGTTPDELCALHARLVGHRRHVRPD